MNAVEKRAWLKNWKSLIKPYGLSEATVMASIMRRDPDFMNKLKQDKIKDDKAEAERRSKENELAQKYGKENVTDIMEELKRDPDFLTKLQEDEMNEYKQGLIKKTGALTRTESIVNKIPKNSDGVDWDLINKLPHNKNLDQNNCI